MLSRLSTTSTCSEQNTKHNKITTSYIPLITAFTGIDFQGWQGPEMDDIASASFGLIHSVWVTSHVDKFSGVVTYVGSL